MAVPQDRWTAPFTDDQVKTLNKYQIKFDFHPYTCGNDSNHSVLVATNNGWICTACGYTQNWAHNHSVRN